MAYVYRHIRLDNEEVFNIGIGKTLSRAYSSKNRNKHWHNIVKLSGGKFKVDILFSNISWDRSCRKEKRLIKLYGRSDLKLGTLCNLTDGGEGNCNPSIEVRKKLSLGKIGTNNPQFGTKRSQEWKDMITTHNRNLFKDKPLSEEHRAKLSAAHIGMTYSMETIEKRISKLRKKVINTSTGEIFLSIKDVAVRYNMPGNTTTRWIKAGKLNLKFI